MLDTMLAVVLLVLGAALLTLGAETFARHVRGAASTLGISVLAAGAFVAGAAPEEAVTAMVASGQGYPALAAGAAIGSNLVVLTLCLGPAAVRARLPVGRRVLEYAGAASVAGALPVLFLWNGVMGRLEGGLLVLLYAAGVAWMWRRERQPPVAGVLADLDTGYDGRSRSLLMVLLGLLGMVAGGYLAVLGADGLVGLFEVTQSAVGLTVLALATSGETVALVWAGHRHGLPEVVLAGAVGAVVYNATVSLGLGALVSPLAVGRGSPTITIGLVTAVLPLLLFAGARSGRLPRVAGLGLLLAYAVAVGWLFSR